jgi:hypothetical protein
MDTAYYYKQLRSQSVTGPQQARRNITVLSAYAGVVRTQQYIANQTCTASHVYDRT